jgi:hypothetical protein
MKLIKSSENELIWQDVKKAIKNSLIFASPLIVLFITQLQAGKTPQEAALFLYAAALQLALDLFKKWANENTYKL